jgi:WD40 repeat protein
MRAPPNQSRRPFLARHAEFTETEQIAVLAGLAGLLHCTPRHHPPELSWILIQTLESLTMRRIARFSTAAPLLAVFVVWLSLQASVGRADDVSWQHDVAPVVQKYCVGCHNKSDAEGGLSLQSPAEILTGSDNGDVLERGDAKHSALERVLSATDDTQMPPVDEPQPSDDQRKAILRWLESGAVFDVSGAAMLKVPDVAVSAEHVVNPILAVCQLTDDLVATAVFGRIQIRNAGTLKVIREIPVGKQKILDIQSRADGSELLIATGLPGVNGSAVSFDVATGERIQEYAGPTDIVYAARYSPDGSMVATAGYDRIIRIHERDTGRVLQQLRGHNGAVFDLAFSPDGQLLASASADSTIKVWHVASGQRLDTLSQPLAEQYAVTFSADGTHIFAAGADSRIRKYQVVSRNTAAINPLISARFAHDSPINQLSVSRNGRFLASASDDRSLKIWDVAGVRQLDKKILDGDRITCVTFDDQSNSVLVGTAQGHLLRKDLRHLLDDSGDQSTIATAEWKSGQAGIPVSVTAKTPAALNEAEPNDTPDVAQTIALPSVVAGVISSRNDSTTDADCCVFEAAKGQTVCINVSAAREKSPLDSIVEVLNADGTSIVRVLLQAQRDSWFTFRGKDADTSDDFRMFNWQEMELNEYLYSDGEVVRLWLYPRGPDSGFKVYPGFGSRFTWFGTTPTAHALQAPAFIVKPLPPAAQVVENGLPVFSVHYENDDDPIREWGNDSRLIFVARRDGRYVVRIRDARGFGGDDYTYKLTVRDARPDFHVSLSPAKLTVYRGTGREVNFTARRIDGFAGPIEIKPESVPEGFALSEPIIIERDQLKASATLYALPNASQPDEDAVKRVRFVASAGILDELVTHDVGALTELKLVEDPKLLVRIVANAPVGTDAAEHVAELTIHPGQTLSAWVQIDRINHNAAVSFGKEDSGRNLPHGLYVDNIGLNGLLIPAGQTVREVFITAAKWVPESSHPFYLKANIDGGLTSLPVTLHVRHRGSGR